MSFFNDNLRRLDFNPADKDSRALLFVSELNDTKLTPIEIFALEDAKSFKATAVYFRHFTDGRAPIPQIYIYDCTERVFGDSELAEIHRDLWSYCRIPLFIVIEKTDVKIFDARKPVEISDKEIKTSPIDVIKIADEAIKLYSKKLFDSGVFWEKKEASEHFLESTSAYNDLIKNLKIVREKFLKVANLPKGTANKLLVFSILIKYLEERGNQNKEGFRENSEGLFAKNFFKEFGAENFCEVLKQGKIIDLFDELSRHFNGKIFEWSDTEERELVRKTDLTELALFLYGDIKLETRQYYFWRKYSFNHLPVELISSVYEEFLNERKDAVYTPEFLVNTLTDECLPQREFDKLSVKTIDVSCGSGIFLVSVFKRLAQRHRYLEFKKTKQLKRLSSAQLLEIIKNNIFGVDIEEDAIRLTVFSLCLALCDELTPKEIWTKLKFGDTFQKNFKTKNFFDDLENDKSKIESFDLVIGNAPFAELKLEKGNEDIYYFLDQEQNPVNLTSELSQKLNGKKNVFTRHQLALMFLDQAPRLLKKGGALCLIMPSAPLLYNNSIEFRKHFFSKHQVTQILDFTNLEGLLYGSAKVSTAAIFVKNQPKDEEKPIAHIIIRRTKSVEEKIFFEIDKYDFHYVPQKSALTDKHIWKCNLLGGGRLHSLIYRLLNVGSIKDYVKQKKWTAGEGYIIGSANLKPAPYITGKWSIPTKAFTVKGLDTTKIARETSELFEGIRTESLFTPPVLIIKENIGQDKIPTYFSDKYLTFNQKMVGIASPQTERDQLFQLYESFEKYKEIYKLFITATSNEYLIKRATAITKQDIMNLPYSEEDDEMKLSFVEQIICDDVLKFQIEMISKGSGAKANCQEVSKFDLNAFGRVFSKALNSVYEETDKCFYLKNIFGWGEFYITEFNYGKHTNEPAWNKIEVPNESLNSLIQTEYGKNTYVVKILKLYERNKIYFIKPKTLRYWLRSVAIKDADEVFTDSIKTFTTKK